MLAADAPHPGAPLFFQVTQYKAGKASGFAQGKRRYDSKQMGFGGQTKPVFHKKVSRRVWQRTLGSGQCWAAPQTHAAAV